MSWLGNLWTKVKTWGEGEAQTVETALTPFEQKIVQGASLLAHQIEATIGQQGYTLLEQGLADIGTLIASGGNVGAAISTLVPTVVSQVKDDLKQDATNAAHGAVSLIIASAQASFPRADAEQAPVAVS